MSAGADGAGEDPVPEELAADVVGRALHALEPDEEDRVAEHLRDCAACRALLWQTHETMAALAHTVPASEPPAALRERILAAAAAEPDPGPAPQPDRRPDPEPDPQLGPRPDPQPAPRSEAPPDAGRPAAGSRGDGRDPTRELPAADGGDATVPPSRPPSLPHRRTAAILALAAVVAGIVVFAARGAVGPETSDPRTAVAQRAHQVVASAEARDPSVRSASLIAPETGTIAAVVLDDGAGPRVVPLDLPAIGSGRTFVLWRVSGSSASPVGTVDPTGSLTPLRPTATPAPGPGAPSGGDVPSARRAYALSAEPVGTVPTRPSAVVASGPLV